jgi:hypothetical protein
VQLDEKWSYVFKKQGHCDPDGPADANRGDYWDHVALDAESRLVLAVVPGARDAEAVEEVVGEVKGRTGGRVLDLATSDEYAAYETALVSAYGQEVTTTATGRVSREMVPEKIPPAGMNYATAQKGRVVEVVTRVAFGTMAAIRAVLAKSKVSRHINTSILER